jgi:hypothetical protein
VLNKPHLLDLLLMANVPWTISEFGIAKLTMKISSTKVLPKFYQHSGKGTVHLPCGMFLRKMITLELEWASHALAY